MSGQIDQPVRSQGGDRVLSLGALRFHHNHLQGRRKKAFGCLICEKGLEGVMAKVEERPAPPEEVAEGGGADEEGDAPSPYGAWSV